MCSCLAAPLLSTANTRSLGKGRLARNGTSKDHKRLSSKGVNQPYKQPPASLWIAIGSRDYIFRFCKQRIRQDFSVNGSDSNCRPIIAQGAATSFLELRVIRWRTIVSTLASGSDQTNLAAHSGCCFGPLIGFWVVFSLHAGSNSCPSSPVVYACSIPKES